MLARWTSDFDCGYETNWWYVIKDKPFDIASLKAKRRYEINKGKKNFTVTVIKPTDYVEDLLEIQIAAYSAWPEKYRPAVDGGQFKKSIENWNDCKVYGAFNKESRQLCGYAQVQEYPRHLSFSVLRTDPNSERFGVNAAIVARIVEDYNEKLAAGFYINDGERSIRHETAFQDYLEKYFGFRKAYCHLNVRYRCLIKWFVRIAYPFRKRVNKESKIGSLLAAVLSMEEIIRKNQK